MFFTLKSCFSDIFVTVDCWFVDRYTLANIDVAPSINDTGSALYDVTF